MAKAAPLGPGKLHRCDLCPFESSSFFTITKHIRRHQTGVQVEDIFACIAPIPSIYKCDICDFATGIKVVWRSHIDVIHKKQRERHNLKLRKCKKCAFNTYSVVVFARHCCKTPEKPKGFEVNTVDGVKWYKCEHCPYNVKYLCSMKKHILSKHTKLEDIKWQKCQKCSYVSKQKSHLRRHLLLRHSSNPKAKVYKCRRCQFTTESKAVLTQHKQEHKVPKNTEWLLCDQCSYETNIKSNLKRHILVKHTDSADIVWLICDQCSFQTKRKDVLEKHLKWKHGQSKKFECEFCSYKAIEKSRLKMHVQNKHTDPSDVEWFDCGQCDYKTKFKKNLPRHVLRKHVHPDCIAWFECERCNYKAKLKVDLRRHSERKHGIVLR